MRADLAGEGENMRWFGWQEAPQSAANAATEGTMLERLAEPQHPQLALLLDYWEEKRGAGRTMPARGDISPTDIPRLMPHLVLFDILEDGKDGQIRVFGSELTEMVGEDRTGMRLSQINCQRQEQSAQNIRLRWLNIFHLTVAEKAPTFVKAPMSNSGRDFMIFHGACLPLCGKDSEEMKQILGILVTLPRSADELLPPPVPYGTEAPGFI